MSKLLSYTKSDFGQRKTLIFNKTNSRSLAEKDIKIQHDTYYNGFRNYKLETKNKNANDNEDENENRFNKQDN